MAHVTTTEADIEKVYRIARELGIGLEEAAITCDAFELAFSDDRMRRAIFGLIDELDHEAYKKGEPLGMILSYAVELGIDGISVTRHANEIPPGQVVSLTPTNRAMIFVKIKDNFPTQQFLGPLIVNRPEWEFAVQSREAEFEEPHVSSDSFDTEIPDDLSRLEPPRQPICLGPIRQTFNERFPFVSTRTSFQPATLQAVNPAFQSKALTAHGDLPPWAAGMPALQSGLSPPPAIGECGHSVSKDVPPALANRR